MIQGVDENGVPDCITLQYILWYMGVQNNGSIYIWNPSPFNQLPGFDEATYDGGSWGDLAREQPAYEDVIAQKDNARTWLIANYPNEPGVLAYLDAINKVDKVSGKGLSTNDFTNTEKTNVDALNSASTHAATDFATASQVTTDEAAAALLTADEATKISLSSMLTGLGAGTNTAIAATDTLLSALAKIQAQLTAQLAKFTRTTSTLTLSIVGTGATGTQISATKDSTIHINLSNTTTSTIGGPSVSDLIIKMCNTNSATESDWVTQDDIDNEQTVTLALSLQSIQVIHEMITIDIPAGVWIKIENSGSGTHAETILRGQKTIYG